MIERVVFGTAQERTGTGRVDLRPGQTLTVGLCVTATSASELAQASAFVWTDYGSDDPRTFHEWTTGRYDVGARMRAWLDVAAFYQVRDRVGFDPERPLWSRPIVGGQLVEHGLSVGLQRYQIQVLELERLP